MKDRRSISPEMFSGRQVHREQIELMLTNATWAPTHGMTQPWRFTAYVGEGMKKIGPMLPAWYQKFAGPSFSSGKFEKLKARGEAVTALIAIGMEPDPNGRISEADELAAVACAVQNLHLTATAYGIGGFWSSPKFISQPEVLKFVGLSEKGKLLGLFYLGYPKNPWPQSHRKPLEYVCHWVD